MENTIAAITPDSNSESDISDSWALIDEDSSLEWNNEMGLGPRQFIFERLEVPSPRTSSRNELSDEDSIEVVADYHTDSLSDNEVEETKSEKWTTGTVVTENLRLLENEGGKPRLGTIEDVTSNIPSTGTPVQPKKYMNYSSTPALIAIFVMGIVGGIAVGYSLAFNLQTSEDSASIQNTRALLAKLHNEILFLQHQLHFAHSSLKVVISKLPQLKDSLKSNVYNKSIEGTFNVDNAGMCTITDFILQSHFRHVNISTDVCLANENPQQNNHILTMRENIYGAVSSSFDAILPKTHIEILNTTRNNSELNEHEEVNTWQIDKVAPIHRETPSALADTSLQNETPHNKNVPQHARNFESEVVNTSVNNNESGTDPRPFTRLRNIVENIYAMVSVFGNDIQTAFPSKLEFLSILPQNMVDFDFSVETVTPENYKKIAAFKNQLQDTAKKLVDNIESSIDSFIKNIAYKFEKFETSNRKRICKLKRKIENSPGTDNIDWNKPIFQKCIDYQQNDHAIKSKNTVKVNDGLLGNEEEFVISTSTTFDDKKPRDKHGVKKGKRPAYNTQNENTQQTLTLNENFEFKERSEFSHDKIGQSSKMSPKIEKNISENKKSNKYDAGVQEKEMYLKHKNKHVQPDRQMRRTKGKEDKTSKLDEKRTDFFDGEFEQYEMKKTYGDREKNHENDEDHEKMRTGKKMVNADGTDISGEWTLKMAHGRAELRRRERQSDWIFDRAESRKSSREKDSTNAYWYKREDYRANNFNSNICNKTKTFKNQASKAWKDMKHHVKENVWRPIVDTAKTAKRVFNNFNNYHS